MKDLNSYTVEADSVIGRVSIIDDPTHPAPLYSVSLPSIGKATEAFLSQAIEELAKKVPVDVENITDPKIAEKYKKTLYHSTYLYLKSQLSQQSEQELKLFTGILLHRMYGLGYIEVVLADNFLEEVVVNGSKQSIAVYHKDYGWCKTNVMLATEDEILNFSSQIGRKVGKQINVLNPIMDAHLMTGDRVASTLFPISTAGHTMTIRRFARRPWTIVDFLSKSFGTTSPEIAALIWQAMEYELNIIIAGGTASGKSSFLNTLCSFIPPKQRVISVEDTREIQLPESLHWNWVPLTSRSKNPEGHGEVTMLDLIIAALRMRPDRIVVGEIRHRDQASALFEAMHTGHSVYATMHADTASQVKRRLVEPPISIPEAEIESLHLILVQYRDRKTGRRRTLEVAEVLSGGKNRTLELNILYRWIPRTDTFEKVNDSVRVLEDLNLHTGMTKEDILNDQANKVMILQWLVNQGKSDIVTVGAVFNKYYKNSKEIISAAKANKPIGSVV